jgi:DNA-binding PadR family transcriptional regulator
MSHEQPDLPRFRAALLDAIAHGKGKYTWYQLDRVVVSHFPFSKVHLMPTLRTLEEEGLIESVPNEDFPAQPFYRVRSAPRRRAT